jgi:tetratricopeptide (TPR) repeat protein
VYDVLGNRSEALDYFNHSLAIKRDVGDRNGEATTLNNIGRVYDALGNRSEALDYFNHSLAIKRDVGDRNGEATTLNNIGLVYHVLGNRSEALDYFNLALPIFRDVGDRNGEAATLNNIGSVYDALGNRSEALNSFNLALPIFQDVGDRNGEATTLNNIGLVYHALDNRRQALEYFNRALPILQDVGDRPMEATTLNNRGGVYDALGNRRQALDDHNQALSIQRDVGDRPGEATTLSNIAAVYRDTNQSDKAISYWENSLNILLSLRGELQKDFRESFLQINRGPDVVLVDLLIDQNQPQQAFEWANRVTTYELADYNRLIGVQVANPEIQAALDDWNEQLQQVQALRQQLPDNTSETLVDQIRDLEAQLFQQAETLANNYPEIAELFEIEPEDLNQLQASIPPGTVILQPVLLTDIQNVPDTIALFLLSRDSLSVKKVPIEAEQFRTWVSDYYNILQSQDIGYRRIGGHLYDHLIRPIEEDIAALNPQQLGIIATGDLRRFPFETLWDSQEETFLLEHYPIHYLTRLSRHSLLAEPRPQSLPRLPLLPLSLGLGGLGLGLMLKSRPWGGAVL